MIRFRFLWKVYGPDLNGRFGGLQGTGGLEAVILDADGTTTGVINDQFGNGVATVTGTGSSASVTWNTTRVGAYGPLPGVQAQTLTDVTQLAAATAWRSHRIDPTGFYWLGARYYQPTSGRFLSADPMGQAASPSLYDFCNGDPVNFFDPTGRCKNGATADHNLVADIGKIAENLVIDSLLRGNPVTQLYQEYQDIRGLVTNYQRDSVDYGTAGAILRAVPVANAGADIHDVIVEETTSGRPLGYEDYLAKGTNITLTAGSIGVGVVAEVVTGDFVPADTVAPDTTVSPEATIPSGSNPVEPLPTVYTKQLPPGTTNDTIVICDGVPTRWADVPNGATSGPGGWVGGVHGGAIGNLGVPPGSTVILEDGTKVITPVATGTGDSK